MNLKIAQLYRNIHGKKKLTLLESPWRQTRITTLPWFLAQCTTPGRNRNLGPAAQLLLEEKSVVGAARYCSESCSFRGGVRAPHIPARPQSWRVRLPCFPQRTAVLSISLLDSVSYFIYKPSAFSSVQQSHVSWTLRNSPFYCKSIFLIHNVLFPVHLQVKYFDRLCLSFIIPVSVHCLPIEKYIYYSPPVLASLQDGSSEHNYFHTLKIRLSLHELIYR